jgi:prephenate dehydratase
VTSIAFQGEWGAYSEEAIHQFFGSEGTTLPCRTFEGIFQAVESGEAEYGVLPVENSRAGSINFFVFSQKEPPRAQRNKTSVVFAARHEAGALYECMGEFAKRSINLTKIESRPRINRPWQYIFYLDIEGHSRDPECEAALMGLLRRSSFVKLLGSYAAATMPIPNDHAIAPG